MGAAADEVEAAVAAVGSGRVTGTLLSVIDRTSRHACFSWSTMQIIRWAVQGIRPSAAIAAQQIR